MRRFCMDRECESPQCLILKRRRGRLRDGVLGRETQRGKVIVKGNSLDRVLQPQFELLIYEASELKSTFF